MKMSSTSTAFSGTLCETRSRSDVSHASPFHFQNRSSPYEPDMGIFLTSSISWQIWLNLQNVFSLSSEDSETWPVSFRWTPLECLPYRPLGNLNTFWLRLLVIPS